MTAPSTGITTTSRRPARAPPLMGERQPSALSYTQIHAYQTCSLKWHFQYVERLPRERISGALLFGAALHGALEHWLRQQMAGQAPPSPNELLTVFDNTWSREAATAPVQFSSGDSRAAQQQLAERVLAAFLASEAARLDGELLGIEEDFRARVRPLLPPLRARLDWVVLRDDAVVIRDFKSARARWSELDLSHNSDQLRLYAAVAAPLTRTLRRPLRAEFIVLTKTKSPAVQVLPVELTPATTERLLRIVGRVWRAMRTAPVYPNPSPLNCSGCPYRSACQSWQG